MLTDSTPRQRNWRNPERTFVMATPTRERLQALENRRESLRRQAERFLSGIRETRGADATLDRAEATRFAAMQSDLADLAGAIAALRTGSALCERDLLLPHPSTWATLRTQKDQYGRFLATPDPTADQAETAWDIDVLVSTQFTAGEAVLVDTTQVGRVAVRER